MVLAFGVSLAFVLVKAFPPAGQAAGYPFAIEPVYAGLGVSLAIYAAGWAAGSRPAALAGHAPVGAERQEESP
jgi:hypothetical protein